MSSKTYVVAACLEDGAMHMAQVIGYEKPVYALIAGLLFLKFITDADEVNEMDEVEFIVEALEERYITVGVLEVLTNDPA